MDNDTMPQIVTPPTDDLHADPLFWLANFEHFYTDKYGRHFLTCQHCNGVFALSAVRLPVAAPGMEREPGLVRVQSVERGK